MEQRIYTALCILSVIVCFALVHEMAAKDEIDWDNVARHLPENNQYASYKGPIRLVLPATAKNGK